MTEGEKFETYKKIPTLSAYQKGIVPLQSVHIALGIAAVYEELGLTG